jgi:hypothetical protein
MSFISLFVCQRFASHASLDGKTHWQSSTASSHIGDDDSRREFSSYSFFPDSSRLYIPRPRKKKKEYPSSCDVQCVMTMMIFYFIFFYIHLPLSSADGFDSSLVIHSGDHPDELWAGAFIILIDDATIYITQCEFRCSSRSTHIIDHANYIRFII